VSAGVFLVSLVFYWFASYVSEQFLKTEKGDYFLSIVFGRTKKSVKKSRSDSHIGECFVVNFKTKRRLLFHFVCFVTIIIFYCCSGKILLTFAVMGILLGLNSGINITISSQEGKNFYKTEEALK